MNETEGYILISDNLEYKLKKNFEIFEIIYICKRLEKYLIKKMIKYKH